MREERAQHGKQAASSESYKDHRDILAHNHQVFCEDTQVVSVSTTWLRLRYLALQSYFYYSSNEVHYLQYYKKDNSKLLKKKFEDKNDTKYYYIRMNLVSSESHESDDGAEDIDHECCRGGLYVAQTRLNDTDGRRRDFLGLFTRRKIKRGEFIGFYTGEWYTERAYNRLR